MRFEFGVLPEWISLSFKHWEIIPVDDHKKTIEDWQKTGDDHDWVYPSFEAQKRGAWKLPSTHQLIYKGRRNAKFKNEIEEVATFLIYLIGLVYGIQLQHSATGWFVRGKQPKRIGGAFYPSKASLRLVLDLGRSWFTQQSKDVQIAATSGLFIHNLVPAFERDWERFSWQYASFDTAWFIAQKTGLISAAKLSPHGKRLWEFARTFGLRRNKKQFSRWVKYRNDLVHQVTWGRVVPGHRPRTRVRRSQMPLRDFTTLAYLALLGYKGKSLRSRLGGLSVQLLEL